MIGSVIVLCIVGFVLWLLLNAGTGFAATKLEFLEPDAPDSSHGGPGERSRLRVRYGPLSLRAKHVLLAEKSLKIVSGFLIGLYPVDVTQVRVDEYRVHFGWGLMKFIKAWWKREERERLEPKLIIRLVGVRVAIKGNGIDDWEKQAEAMAAGIEGGNHNQANLLTALIDKTTPEEGVPPSYIFRLVDAVINAVDVEVEGFHLSLASANHKDTPKEGTQPQQQDASDIRPEAAAAAAAAPAASSGTASGSHCVGCEWVLGVKFDRFRLCKKAHPSDETLGVTPRTLKVKSFNMYYDTDGTPVRGRSSFNKPDNQQRESVGSPPPAASGATAVVREENDPELYIEDGALPLTSGILGGGGGGGGGDGLRQPDDHNSLLMVESIGGTLLFPDLMCVLLGVGRQPGGKGKILAVDFDQMRGVVVELEPFQVFSLLNDALPLLAMMGPYAEWCSNARLQWHKEAFARRPGAAAGGVPVTPEELEKYAEALGSLPDGDGEKKYKGDAAELRKLDKNMSLSQIMLTRMRVRNWDATRPERVMLVANLLLNSIDPFQGVPAEDLEGTLVSEPEGAAAGDGGGGAESDEEAPSISSGQSEAPLPSLPTDGPEEDDRLEALLYYAAQESAYAGAENPVLMEIDIRMSAQDVSLLVYHPPRDNNKSADKNKASSREVDLGQGGDDNDSIFAGSSDGGDDGSLPEMDQLSRQHSGGSVKLGGDDGELATEEALRLRDSLQLPALAASVAINDFKFGFNMLMGSVAAEAATTPCAEGAGEGGPSPLPPGDAADAGAGAAAGAGEPEEEGPVQLHTFSGALFPDALPIRLYKPSRLGQGADLRVESYGDNDKVGDGVAGMNLSLVLGGTRVTDFGALEEGGVLPTLIGGPAAVSAGGDGDDSHAAGGTTKATLALFVGGRLEAGLDFQSCTVVALPGRIMAIIDVVLACLMGPPAAREAQELNALEEEVEAEEEEEATGGAGTTEVVDARWKAIDKVRGAYLFLGRLDARFSVRVDAFSLILPQDSRDARTNVVMAQCSALTLDMKSGSAFEALAVSVYDFSVAPCVQRPEASDAAIVSCGRLHETGVAIALRGPLPELLEVIHRGLPLKDLDLFPIPERRIILPVKMKIKYSTYVALTAEDTLEASTATLVTDMVQRNSGSDLAAMRTADLEQQQLAVTKLSRGEEEDQASGGPTSAAAETDGNTTDSATASEVQSGWHVKMEVQLHVSSGLYVKVTDLDIAVLQGIATSLIASLGVGEAATPAAGGAPPAAASGQSAAGKSLTFALDKAQRRMVASLRQAFRLADVNGDGNLDREEVEALLRLNLQGQNLDPTQTEAEVLQFIALLDADGTETLDIDEFTSTMMRLMTDGPDEVTLARARRQALTKAFDEADTDGSGFLDAGEILELLKSSDPLRTHSELDRQVTRYIEAVDVDNDGQLDLEEFIELVQSMREGGVHEGPLEPKAEEFRSWEVIKPMLEGYKTLPELLAARPPDYSPPGFWELFEAETHATKSESAGQLAEAVQAKMVKTFENYGFAGDAWSFLVAPAWYPGVVRVGSLAVAGDEAGGSGGGGRSKTIGPQQIPAPVRPGALVYAQEQASSSRRASPPPGALSGMRIQRLPKELAAPPATPPAVDPLALSTPPPAENYATGVRLPAPRGTGRRRSMRGASSSASPPGVRMEIDRPCTLLVCFHDEHASADAGAGAKSGIAGAKSGIGGEGRPGLTGARSSSSTSSGGSRLDVPKWADEMGLRRTGMHIDAVLPGDGDSASTTSHVYRVFSTPIAAGAVELGPGLPGSLPYFVLLYGGNHRTRRTSRTPHGRLAAQRPVRAVTDSGRGGRRVLRSLFRKHNVALGGSGSGGGSGGSSINSLSRQSRGSSAGAVVSSLDRGISGESIEMTPTPAAAGLGPAAPPERRTSMVSTADSVGPAATAAMVKGNPSWQLTPEYSLGGASRGVSSIGAKADKNAKMAASSAMKIAAISSAGTTAANAAGGAGGGAGGIDVAKKPRVRLKVTLLCEHGIFVQMDDIHRLENTPSDDSAAPTFELALRVPRQDRGGVGGASGTNDAKSPASAAGSVPAAPAAEASPPSTEALAATLDFEHVASSEILGDEDSMSMDAAFGIEGKYFNPRVHQSEHFIEPWSMSIKMSDPRGESTPRGQMIADQHFVLNVTTGLTSLACTIMESRDYAKTRYSTTSVYTELRDGNDGDDGTRLLTIENHLGVPVRVTLEEDASSSGAAAREKGRPFGSKKTGWGPAAAPPEAPADATSGNFCRIASTLYDQQEGGGDDGPPSDRVSVGELTVPNAKMALPTATVTIKAKGFEPVTGVPLDLLGRGTHVYRMTRSGRSGEDRGSKKWRYEGLVVKFVARAARTASVLDLAMQLQTNVALKNDLPRPLRVALSPENENHPNTLVPVDAEVCLPFPLLRGKVLRLWKSPRTLVGGEALKRALQADADRQAGGKRGSGAVGLGSSTRSADRYGTGGWDGAASEAAAVDVADEVSVEISPTTFDRNKRVVERHSQGMLVNGVSVERADLAPTPGLVMHGSGDEAPALWRLYTRAPYVVQNGLACDVVLWASQPLAEEGNATLDTVLESPGPASSGGRGLSASAGRSLKGRLSLKKLGLSPKRDSGGSGRPRSSASSGSKFSFTPKSWKKGSGAPFREGGGDGSGSGGSGGSGGAEEVNKLDSDSDDHDDHDDDDDDEVTTDDTDTDLEHHDDEEMEIEEQELDRLSAIGATSGGDGVIVAGAGSGGPPNNGRVMWVLKSGEEAKLEGMDPTRHLRLRVGFAPADGSSSCSDFCKSYIIEAKRHTNRTLLNRTKSKEAVFSQGARGSGGARRPEFKFGVVWEHTPGNRHIHLYSKVWVLNKTGVSLAYRASIPTEEDRKEKVFVRRPYNASYRTDGDTMLFSRYMTGARRCKSFGGGDKTGGGGATASDIGGEAGFPLMLTCHANTLQTMPYAMADSAVGSNLLLSETRSSKSEQPLPCLTVPAADDADADAGGGGGGGGGAESSSWPLYCDYPPARVRLPEEVLSEGRRRVHLLTLRSDTGSVTFTPSRDCRVYIGVDKRLLAADPGPPKWLALQGFERREGLDVSVTDVQPADLAPQGFGLYSRFCRGLSVVPLGQNLDHDGDGVSEKRGGPAAMYFVVVVRVPESEAVEEVDIGPVAMHRSVAKIFDMREHHRWRMKPNFKPGDPCYTDRPSSENTVTGLPEKLRGLKLMHIATSQGDKKVKAKNMASFQTLQRSRVLVCFDSRAPKPPSWLAARGFAFQDDLHLPIDPAGTGTNGYKVYAKTFIEGAEVKLGGNKASGAKRMYFVLVHATGDQQGRISAPPVLPTPSPLAPPSPANAAAANPDPFGDGGGVVAVPSPAAAAGAEGGTSSRLSGATRKGGVFAESHDDQVFRFWDDKASGKLVQTPLDLDRHGRGWCQPFATDAVKTAGEAKSPAGVFGVTVEALSGAFLKTRVVTVWPRFVVRNNLGRRVGVLSTVEPPPKRGKDHGQSIARVTEEEKEDLKNVQRASRKKTQALPDGASVILYDFTDPDDYDFDEDEDAQDASARFGVDAGGSGSSKPTRKQLQRWKRTSKKDKEGKLPCVRLLSGVHKDGGPGRKGSSRSGGSGEVSALGEGGGGDEQWVELPTVPVLLESLGKDTYVWMEGGHHQEDVLVRVSCRMLSNGATIHVVLSNETPSPPLRIENRSSTQTLCYRLGGDAEDNVRLLEPMRWNSLHWVNDDKRVIEAAVYEDHDQGRGHRAARSIRKRKDKVKDALKTSSRRGPAAAAADDDDAGGRMGDAEKHAVSFSSFRWGSRGKFGDSPRREYRTEDVGRLKDLVGAKRKGGGGETVRLKVECLRPPDSVVTTVLAFSDTPDGVYATSALAVKDGSGEKGSDARDDEALENGGAAVETKFARIWTGLHFEANFAGLVLNIIDSTPSGPSELAAFTVDNFELGKPSGTPGVTVSVWHFQLDDMRADSPHPIILAPQCTGFNSHLTKVHYNGLSGSPAFRVEVERDVEVSLTHHMWVMRSIEMSLGKVHCAVHVDFWIDVQDVVFASLNWTNSSPAEARARAIADTQGVVGNLLQAPAADATVDRIYIGDYFQEEIEVAVDFHLGTKVAALLSSKPPADGDEEKDEGGFGASLAMMPLGAVGGVVWGLLSSFGAGIANASPTFKFDAYELEHYYGSKTQAVTLVVMSFAKQGIAQAYKVLGHIDILGDPLSLGMNISSGVIGFVTKAGAGHIGEGSKDLVKGVVGGTASSASKMTDAFDNFVREAGGMDAEAPSGMESKKAPEHLGQGLTQGMMYFGHTVKDGITGVVMKPVRGARKSGAVGFVKGVGQGVVGLVAAPVSATLGATSKITASIDATTRLLDDDPMGRRREPRHPLGRGERDDRDRLKQELKKARRKKRRDSAADADLEDVGSDGGGGDGADVVPVDTEAEAGGMGLLLVPLTPADFRTNYPEEYLERCLADMASRAGAVAIADKLEADLARFKENLAKKSDEETPALGTVIEDEDGGGGGGGGGGGAEESKGEEGGGDASEGAAPVVETD